MKQICRAETYNPDTGKWEYAGQATVVRGIKSEEAEDLLRDMEGFLSSRIDSLRSNYASPRATHESAEARRLLHRVTKLRSGGAT